MKPSFQISTPSSSAIEQLNAIAWKAKTHWNYPMEWMELWRNDLRIDLAYLKDHKVLAVELNGKICAWGSLEFDKERQHWEIGHLWVHPEVMGQGIGKTLVSNLLQAARSKGAKELYILSDPHARAFYEKMGAIHLEDVPSTPQGRTLPLMRMEVN